MRALLTAALVLIIGLGVLSVVCADVPYSAQVTAVQSTLPNTWTYTVQNTSSVNQYKLWAFGIEVDEGSAPLTTSQPVGWTPNFDQENLVLWIYASELGVGIQKSGFQATFSAPPAFQRFTAQFDNSYTGEVPEYHGIVSGTTPEPAGVAVLLTGLAPFVGLAFRRKLRS